MIWKVTYAQYTQTVMRINQKCLKSFLYLGVSFLIAPNNLQGFSQARCNIIKWFKMQLPEITINLFFNLFYFGIVTYLKVLRTNVVRETLPDRIYIKVWFICTITNKSNLTRQLDRWDVLLHAHWFYSYVMPSCGYLYEKNACLFNHTSQEILSISLYSFSVTQTVIFK